MPTNKKLVRKDWYCTKRVLKKNINRDKEELHEIFFKINVKQYHSLHRYFWENFSLIFFMEKNYVSI